MINIKIKTLQQMMEKAAEKFVSKEEAAYFARQAVDTYLKKQPRTGHLTDLMGDIEAWEKHPDVKMEIEAEKPGSLLLNFNALGPSLKLKYIHDEAEKRAKQNGISLIGLNHGGVHTLNLWTDGMGQRDMISIFMYNGGPTGVVPFGGTRGILGTNPISYAIPTSDKPIIVDMATSEIPFFELRESKENNKTLRRGVTVDAFGEVTTDPSKALADKGVGNILSLGGGYKGYAIVLLIEILTGSLIKSLLSTQMSSGYVVEEHGGILITIDIASFSDIDVFKKSVTEMCNQIRNQKPAKDIHKITIPGDRDYIKRDQLLANGSVDIEENFYEFLQKYNI